MRNGSSLGVNCWNFSSSPTFPLAISCSHKLYRMILCMGPQNLSDIFTLKVKLSPSPPYTHVQPWSETLVPKVFSRQSTWVQ